MAITPRGGDLDPALVDAALRAVIIEEDYDMHKYLECDEDSGVNRYPELVECFISNYNKAVREGTK